MGVYVLHHTTMPVACTTPQWSYLVQIDNKRPKKEGKTKNKNKGIALACCQREMKVSGKELSGEALEFEH